MYYAHRIAEATLRRYLDTFPVVGLTGPRQSGKSTLLRQTYYQKSQSVFL